jgi:hypothetical protein
MIAAALGAASLVAQGTCYQIPDNSMTGSNVIPFGSTQTSLATWGNQKYQILVLSSDVNNKPGNICELGFAPSGTGVRHFDSIRVRLGYFALTGTTLGTSFAANMKNAQTVLDAKNYDWPHTQDKFNPIGLQNGFAYIPQLGHLVIEITVTGAYFRAGYTGSTGFRNASSSNPGGARQRLYAFRWTTEPTAGTRSSSAGVNVEICYRTAMANVFGLGCPGSNKTIPALSFTGTPKINGTFALNVTGGLPNAKMFLVLGAKRLQTPLLLPGTASCNAYPSLDAVLLYTMSATGTFAKKYAVPNNSNLDCVKVYTQAFPWDAKANAFGTSASNYGRLRIGQ